MNKTIGSTFDHELKRSGKSSIQCKVEIVGLAPDTEVGIQGVSRGDIQVVIKESAPFWVKIK